MEKEKWLYKASANAASTNSKSFLISDCISVDSLIQKVADKNNVNLSRFELKLDYLSPDNPILPPYYISDKEDLDVFVFLNLTRCTDHVFHIQLYSSVIEKSSYLKHDEEMIDVPLSAPTNSSQPALSSEPINSSFCEPSSRQNIISDESYIEMLDDDELGYTAGYGFKGNRIPVNGDRQEVRSWFSKKAKTTDVVEISSDDEGISYDEDDDVTLSGTKHKGCDFVNLSDGGEDDMVYSDFHPKVEVDLSENEDDGSLDKAEEVRYYNPVAPEKPENVNDIDIGGDEGNSACPIWRGQKYDSKKTLHNVLTRYALENHFEMRVKRSEPNRLVEECKNQSCSFGSVRAGTTSFEVKRFNAKHSCGLLYDHNHNRHASAEVISQAVVDRFKGLKNGPRAMDIISVMKEMGVDATYHKANRARVLVENAVRGSPEDSYFQLHSWMHMLKQVNPGTHTSVITNSDNSFKYCFWSLGCCIRVVPQLRKVISVDGPHLSGKYLGNLLITTAQDGNSRIYPIAFAVIDTESKDSWSYFFNEMKNNVVPDSADLVIVSDQHLGIKAAVKSVYPLANHGYYIFHMYQNFKGVSTYAGLKDQWFNVAKAYTVDEFNFELERLNRYSPGAVRQALKVPLHQWARAYFEVDRYNIMTTNNSKCINNMFKEERGWPILSLFQSILETYGNWFCERRESASIWCDQSTRLVTAELKDQYTYSLSMSVQWLSECEALVTDGMNKYEVNLRDKTCQCRVFQRDRIPCAHAIALAKDRGMNINTMVSEYYSNAYLRDVYKETIHIVPPIAQWSVPREVSQIACLTPNIKRPPGRPKVNRYRARWEGPFRRVTRRFLRCGLTGHPCNRCFRAAAGGQRR